ncbi:MAG: A/G-specific adenine glycosylase [Patescibacteria group bacterium]
MKLLSQASVRRFREEVYLFYRRSGRSLPWRDTADPYRILVSEIMLQQTQVDRVIPKYEEFLKAFPTIRKLARAPLSEVLRAWSGLGYNRRGVAIRKCAESITRVFGGRVPETLEELKGLPGIGHHTAGSIMAFAFNKPVVFIETNIRSVFIHHFFPQRKKVSDSELLPLIERTLDRRKPRTWYSALMDYGSDLKKRVGNPSRRSKHHVRQSPFRGSHRELRGATLRRLLVRPHSRQELVKLLDSPALSVTRVLRELQREGAVRKRGGRYEVP